MTPSVIWWISQLLVNMVNEFECIKSSLCSRQNSLFIINTNLNSDYSKENPGDIKHGSKYNSIGLHFLLNLGYFKKWYELQCLKVGFLCVNHRNVAGY